MKLLLDMDGVLVDFVSGALNAHGVNHVEAMSDWPKGEWSVEKVLGISTEEFWAKIDDYPRFWEMLSPTRWFSPLIDLAKRHEWAIATTPSRSPKSAFGKVYWLQSTFGVDFRSYYLCAGCKSSLANEETILVDDNDLNVAAFIAAGGKAVLWPQRWNKSTLGTKEAAFHTLEGMIYDDALRSTATAGK